MGESATFFSPKTLKWRVVKQYSYLFIRSRFQEQGTKSGNRAWKRRGHHVIRTVNDPGIVTKSYQGRFGALESPVMQ
jgi:hypothetical protein